MTGKTACVILNYNDCKNTIELVNSIESYEAFDCIIVVDNCSTDDSLQKLEAVKNGKVIVCSSGKNGGYGYGNNFGVRLAKEKYACKYAVVASPDVRFPEDSVCATINCFENFSKCVVSTPVQITVNDNIYEATAWKLPTKSVYIISAVWPLNKLFKIKNIRIKEKYTRADCIMGSFIAVNIDKFLSFGGFDENIFLYCEETALGYRVKNAGLEEYVVKDKYYKHYKYLQRSKKT